MANGLYCSETLPSTPKLRHVSTDSNSENTPPELLSVAAKSCDLICNEVLDEKEILRMERNTKSHQHRQLPESYNHGPVESKIDLYLLNDDRVLQNLLRNEERYLPTHPDYFTTIQTEVKPHMRFMVTDWMLSVCTDTALAHSTNPEVFTLAVNFLDRFLSVCRIRTSQFQLLGAACLFLASKFKAVEHLSSEMMVSYTDYSVTVTELKEWELLILSKLGWELSSSTALDYLDHVLPRLYLPLAVDMKKLRRMTESIICYASLDYHFTYKPASLLAASAILYSLQECVRRSGFNTRETEAAEKIIREVRTCLQILTHAGGEDLEASLTVLASTMPSHLTASTTAASTTSPDSTTVEAQQQLTSTPARSQQQPQHLSAVEVFSAEVSSTVASPPQHPHLNTEYLSAVDVFSDFNSSVLEAVLSPNDSFNSILVT